MKTPIRDYYYYERDINPENGDIIMAPLSTPLYDARWKRKNRVKQLKRTIARLKAENKWLADDRIKLIIWHTSALRTISKIREAEKKASLKVILVEFFIASVFYCIVAFHWVAPRTWTWLDDEQLTYLLIAGGTWSIFLLYDLWKHRQEQK